MSGNKHFNAEKIFAVLFVLTALEVLWGYAGAVWWEWGKLLLWGGLLIFAFFKGLLIAAYFMHLKFEGWIIWGLIVPTPFLILVIFGYVLPDIGPPNHMVHPIGAQYDPEVGVVEKTMLPGLPHAQGHGTEGETN